jgi:hypothetical protein
MYHVWWRGEVNSGFWWGNLKDRGHLEDPGVDGRIILTLNLLTTTIHLLVMLANGRWDLIRRLKG